MNFFIIIYLFIFQLKEYELCIRDITRAFDNSYPNNLMYKLFERKARCLKAQKEYPRALEAMKSAEMWMKYSTLSETKSSNFKKDITKQVESLQEKVSAMAISDFSLKNDHRRAMSAPCKALATPVVKGGVNKEVPCIRDDVRIEYSEDKGRYLVATQDIPPGMIFFVVFRLHALTGSFMTLNFTLMLLTNLNIVTGNILFTLV